MIATKKYGSGLAKAILGVVLLTVGAHTLCEAQSTSTNKTFMLNNGTGGTTDNGLPPSVSNFFAINSNLLNRSVRASGGGGGGGSSVFSPQFSYNAGNGTNIVAGVTVTNMSNVGNLFNTSNSYVAKTNFANVVAVTNRVTFPIFGEQIGDDGSGNLSIFNPFGDVNIGGSSFGAMDGTLNANLINAVVPITDLNNGTGASATTFWRGDGAWKNPFPANAPGVLTNDGSGALSWVVVSGSSGGGASLNSLGVQFQSSAAPNAVTNVIDGMTNFNSRYPLVAGISPNAVMICDSLSSGTGSGTGNAAGVSNYMMFTTNGNYYGLRFNSVDQTYAISGQQIGTISSNYTSTVHTKAPGAGTNTFLMCWGGINDLYDGETAEGTFTFLTNVWHKAHQDGFIVVAFTVTITGQYFGAATPPPGGIGESYAAETARLNTMIRNSSSNWDYLVDTADILPPPYFAPWYLADGLFTHYTNYGQQAIALNVSNVLSRPPHIQTTKRKSEYDGGWYFTNIFASATVFSNWWFANLYPKAEWNTNLNYTQSASANGLGSFYVANTSTGTAAAVLMGINNSDANQSVQLVQPGSGWTGANFTKLQGALWNGGDNTKGFLFLNFGGGGWDFHTGSSGVVEAAHVDAAWAGFAGIIIATNGFSSMNTNILTAATSTSWKQQMSTINSGFTNNFGTNCTININGSVGTFVFWHSGGVAASVACANPLFTNALSTNGWSRSLPFNCGVQVIASGGNANVTVDFGQ
ncbi:MAG TPA: SGNH/GDSL hydrolase family protein [Verrucomicrobiae bacterium]|jgi:hypothetical protein